MPLPGARHKPTNSIYNLIVLAFGSPKIGKTTTFSQFGDDESHKVLFFTTEPGHKFQNIYKWRTKEDEDPQNWNHFLECCRELASQKHDFTTLVIDVADILFLWCASHVCRAEGVTHEGELPFGKGYSFIKKEFSAPINHLAQKGMGIIFISHEQTNDREFGNRKLSFTDTTLSGSAKKVIHGMSDFILYFHTDANGKRMIRTKGTENINAGDRSGKLPEIMPLDGKLLIQKLEECLK